GSIADFVVDCHPRILPRRRVRSGHFRTSKPTNWRACSLSAPADRADARSRSGREGGFLRHSPPQSAGGTFRTAYMSWKQAAIACLALLAVAAGPPGKDRLPADEDPDGRSAWSRFVDGAKDVIHDPLGTSHRRDETKKLPEKTKSKPAQPLEKTKAAR